MNKISVIICILVTSSYSYAEPEKKVLWNENSNAVAFCVYETETRCFIVADETAINVSQVENSNIGKLGITKKEKYERIITLPTKWLRSIANEHIVSFTTQAWLSGKKYTVTEPVSVKNGKYTVR